MQNFKTNLVSKRGNAKKYIVLAAATILFGSHTLAEAKCPRLHSGQTLEDLNQYCSVSRSG